MNNMETKVFLETKLRNLKRTCAKLTQHAELSDEYLNIQNEIKDIEKQLTLL